MVGKVTTWFMTEEERIAYIKKYPIHKTDKPKVAFDPDYQWRPKKANASRYSK
jgi:hypothetical protein